MDVGQFFRVVNVLDEDGSLGQRNVTGQ